MEEVAEMDQEQKAIEICEKNKDRRFVYEGEEGCFEIVPDCNCCGATQNVLFCFQSSQQRRMFSSAGLIEAYEKAVAQEVEK